MTERIVVMFQQVGVRGMPRNGDRLRTTTLPVIPRAGERVRIPAEEIRWRGQDVAEYIEGIVDRVEWSDGGPEPGYGICVTVFVRPLPKGAK